MTFSNWLMGMVQETKKHFKTNKYLPTVHSQDHKRVVVQVSGRFVETSYVFFCIKNNINAEMWA